MANNVKLKRSATPSAVPTTGQLDLGEVAINTYDGKMFIKKDNGTASIVEIGAGGGGGGSVYYKDPVRCATVANGAFSTAFANGQNIDGYTLVTGDRILIKNQSTASENGIYVVNASGAPTRASDMDANSEAQRGVVVYVQFGNANGGSNWQLVAGNADPIVIGTNNNAWLPMQGIAGYSMNGWTPPVVGGTGSIAIGNNAQATAAPSLAIGNNARAAASNSVMVGAFSSVPSLPGGQTILFGSYVPSNIGNSSISIGFGNGSNSSSGLHINMGSSSSQNNALFSINIGKDSNITNAGEGSISLGHFASVTMQNEFTYGSFGFASRGDAQLSFLKHWQVTTNATATEVGTSGSGVSTAPTGRIVLTNDSTYLFDCDIVARNTTTDTESKVWNVKFGIRRGTSAANTALIGAPTYTVFGEDTGTTTWGVSVTADTTNGRPNISVTGEASKTIRWVANIRMTKVSG